MSTKEALIHAATQYDRRQSKKRCYNHYALAHYMLRIDDVMSDHEKTGRPIEDVPRENFNDRMLDALIKAVGE